MVQQPESAGYAGMPSSAIATGLVDYVLTPAAMPAQLVTYVRGPYLVGRVNLAALPAVPAEPMQKIFVLLRQRTGHDFSGYKGSTIRRRIERRMDIDQVEKPNEYVPYLQENVHETEILFKELLIGVTNFFRDPKAWEALGPPLEGLLKSRPAHWPAGCARWAPSRTTSRVLSESCATG